MIIQVEIYEDDNGRRPFEEWFNHLPPAYAAKVTNAVSRIEIGNQSGLKAVGDGVLEWRVD